MRWLAIGLIKLYQVGLRGIVRRRCLFTPTCSRFAIAALREHGFWRALPRIRARLRDCRQPAHLAWELDEHGSPRLLVASSPEGAIGDVPPDRVLDIAVEEMNDVRAWKR
jgi:putative membrane protein insertion efficiency factor